MAMKEEINPKSIIHPGYILGRELKERGILQKTFAAQIGVLPPNLSDLIKGKRNISEQLAQKLEETLNIPAAFWIKTQAKYDYDITEKNLKNVEETKAMELLNEYDNVYKMSVLFKATGQGEKRPSEKLAFCKEVLHFGSPAQQMKMASGYYHKSEKTGTDARMIATWAEIAKYEAARRPKPKATFDKEKMDQLARELCKIFNENHNTLNRVEKVLDEYGIRFCIVPKVEHASIDGYSLFTDGIPAIVITKRFDRIDNVAFAVLHEVGHLKLHPYDEKNQGYINVTCQEEEEEACPKKKKEEKEANDYAANQLIPLSVWQSAPRTLAPNPWEIQKAYTNWAKAKQLNKWIALGRLSYELGIYKFKKDDTRNIN